MLAVRILLPLVSMVMGGLVVGCAPSQAPSALPSYPSAASVFDAALERATASGAEEEQVSVLEAALGAGALTMADLETLTDGLYGCFEQSGLSYMDLAPYVDRNGFSWLNYSFGPPLGSDMTSDQALALGQVCEDKYVTFAIEAYAEQPISRESADAAFRERAPEVLDCLAKNGVRIDDDAPVDEVRRAVAELLQKTSRDAVDGAIFCDP